jgi:hypothetical protein
MSEKFQVMKMREGVPYPIGEYEYRRAAIRYLDRLNRRFLKRGAPLCRMFVLIRGGKLVRGPSAVMK